MTVNSHKVFVFLISFACALTLAHVVVMILWYGDHLPFDEWWHIAFFDLDEEESIGTWFSTLNLFIAGQLSLLQAWQARSREDRWWLWWLLLGLGFHLLSLDEVAGFHEYVNTVVQSTRWTTFGAVIVLVVGLSYFPFLRDLPARTRWWFVVSGMVYIGGAIGVERATDWYDDNDLLDTLEYNLWTACEEFMEMSGIILFIRALMLHMRDAEEGFDLRVSLR